MRVLLIEDDDDDATAIERLLSGSERGAFAIDRRGDLTGGVGALGQERFDVVLLDLNLPDSRGLSTLEKVVETTPDVPVVVLTGLDDDKLAVDALRRGAADYLTKGFVGSSRVERALQLSVERHDLQQEIMIHLEEFRDMGVRQSVRLIIDRLRRPLGELRSASDELRRDRRIRLDGAGWERIDAVCGAASRIEALTRNLVDLLDPPNGDPGHDDPDADDTLASGRPTGG